MKSILWLAIRLAFLKHAFVQSFFCLNVQEYLLLWRKVQTPGIQRSPESSPTRLPVPLSPPHPTQSSFLPASIHPGLESGECYPVPLLMLFSTWEAPSPPTLSFPLYPSKCCLSQFSSITSPPALFCHLLSVSGMADRFCVIHQVQAIENMLYGDSREPVCAQRERVLWSVVVCAIAREGGMTECLLHIFHPGL